MERTYMVYFEATDGCFDYHGTIPIRKRGETNSISEIIKESIIRKDKEVSVVDLYIHTINVVG